MILDATEIQFLLIKQLAFAKMWKATKMKLFKEFFDLANNNDYLLGCHWFVTANEWIVETPHRTVYKKHYWAFKHWRIMKT